MPAHICQIDGCFSAKRPKWQIIINVMTEKSDVVIACGNMSSIICDDCRKTVTIKQILSNSDWHKIIKGLAESQALFQVPSLDRSYLTFKKIPGPEIH